MPYKQYRSRRGFVKAVGGTSAATLTGLAGCSSDSGTETDGPGTEQGTGSGSTSDGGEVADEIVFYNAGGLKYDPATEKNINRFEDETGITVNVNEVPWNNLKTSLTTIWRNEGSKVDAFNGPTWWLADFVRSGWLEPLGLGDGHMGKFPDNLVDLVTFDGKVYMAPQLGKWGSFLYDKEAISSPPDTWSDLRDLNASGDQSGFGFTWANKDVFTFKQFLYQAGGELFNDSWEPTFVDRGVEVLEFFGQLRDNNVVPDGLSSMGEGGVGDAFIAGQFAAVESWTPLGARALDADDWGEDRLGSAKPPKGPASRATFQDTNGVAVSAFAKPARKRAAKKFAKFMSSRKSCKTDFLVEGNPCVVPDVYEDDDVKSAYPSWLLEDMKYNLENAKSETYLAQPQVDDYLSEQITPALLGDKDPQKAIEDAHDNIQRLYQDIGLL